MHAISNSKKTVVALLLPFLFSACSFVTESMQGKKEKTDAGSKESVSMVVKGQIKEEPAIKKKADDSIKKQNNFFEKTCPVANPYDIKKSTQYINMQVVGHVEYVQLGGNSIVIKARIDTGAKTSSLNALELTEFERDGKKWVKFSILSPATKEKIFFERKIERFVRIKQLGIANQRRAVVKMGLKLGKVDENIEVTLTDRSNYVYQLLIGRNFLMDRMLVDVSKKFLYVPVVN